MGSLEHVLIAASFVCGAVAIRVLRAYDVHEREPIAKMVLFTAWGGFVSFWIAAWLYARTGVLGLDSVQNVAGAFLVIGPVEEAAKLGAFLLGYVLIRREIDEPMDGLLYMSCVALGFSLIENYYYALRSDVPYAVMLTRLLTCTPAHIACSLLMGLGAYLWLEVGAGRAILPLAFLFGAFVHGLYDALILGGWKVLAAVLFVGALLPWCCQLLAYATARSPHRRSLRVLIETLQPVREPGLPCPRCGDATGERETFHWERIRFQRCEGCEGYVTDRRSLERMFRHLGAYFWRMKWIYREVRRGGREIDVLYRGNEVNRRLGVAYFQGERLHRVLEDLKREVIRSVERADWLVRIGARIPKPARVVRRHRRRS